MSRSASLLAVAALSIVAGCASTSAPAADAAPTPTFALTVTVSGDGTGTVTSVPTGIACGSDCSETYDAGTVVSLTAVAAAGATFVGWTGGGCGGVGNCVVSVAAATTVTAAFALDRSLVVTRAGTGTGTVTSTPAGISCGADCDHVYAAGTVVTLSAVPAATSTFTGWAGGGCAGTGACAITLTAATMVTATFAQNQVALSVVVTGTGTGTVTSTPAGISCGADCTEAFDPGTAVTLTAVPATGSTFAGWAGGGCTGTSTCAITIAAATAVAATFTLATNCDGFTSANTTTIPGWTERVGDWIIDTGRLRDSTAGSVYSHHITMNGSTQLSGCGRVTAINNGTPSVTSAGVILRWSPPNNFIVALVQDNSSSGNFNSAWIYQYPGVTGLGTALTNQTFGLTPNIEACVVGTTVTLRIDANQDGTYEASTTGTTTITTAGLTGIMALTAGTHPSFDNFCWGP